MKKTLSLENWLRVWWSLTLFFGYLSLIIVGSGLELSSKTPIPVEDAIRIAILMQLFYIIGRAHQEWGKLN